MTSVILIREPEGEGEPPPPLWSGDLPLPAVGATVSVDGALFSVVSHRYDVNVGVLWQSAVTVIVRPEE